MAVTRRLGRARVLCVVAYVLSTMAVGACRTGEFDEWTIRNDTSEAVVVVNLIDGDEVWIGTVLPDLQIHLTSQNLVYGIDCSSGILIARTSAGREIARRTEPLCTDDIWVIAETTT